LERIDVLPAWKKEWCVSKIDAKTCQKKWVFGKADDEIGW
jgi:hypothetical protein